MNRVLITGAGGTVGRALCRALAERRVEAIRWSREAAPPADADAARRLVDDVRPGALYHLAVASAPTGVEDEDALVNETWTTILARLARERGIPFVYTSTVMVFSDRAAGPFGPRTPPDAAGGYGAAKRRGEIAALEAHPDAHVVRLGWQMGLEDDPPGNHMTAHFDAQQADRGFVEVSRRFVPACSPLPLTAAVLAGLVFRERGLYHLDANVGWGLDAIARALAARLGRTWELRAVDGFAQDQRLRDDRLIVPPLSSLLPGLRFGAGIAGSPAAAARLAT